MGILKLKRDLTKYMQEHLSEGELKEFVKDAHETCIVLEELRKESFINLTASIREFITNINLLYEKLQYGLLNNCTEILSFIKRNTSIIDNISRMEVSLNV